MEKAVAKKTEKVLANKPVEKKKPEKLTSKQRIALAALDAELMTFQNGCRKRIEALDSILAKDILCAKTEMSDLVRPVHTEHMKKIKAANRMYEQNKRSLEIDFQNQLSNIRQEKSMDMLDIENAYNEKLDEIKEQHTVAVEKVDAPLQDFIKEDHLKRKQVTGGDRKDKASKKN